VDEKSGELDGVFIYFAFLLGGQLLVKWIFFQKSKKYTVLSSFLGLAVEPVLYC